jgi:hypothetical protein
MVASEEEDPTITITLSCKLSRLADEKKITTLEELDNSFISRYCWKDQTLEELLDESNYYAGIYKEAKAQIEDGKIIHICKCSSEDDNLMEQIIYNHGIDNKNLSSGEIIDADW